MRPARFPWMLCTVVAVFVLASYGVGYVVGLRDRMCP